MHVQGGGGALHNASEHNLCASVSDEAGRVTCSSTLTIAAKAAGRAGHAFKVTSQHDRPFAGTVTDRLLLCHCVCCDEIVPGQHEQGKGIQHRPSQRGRTACPNTL